MRKLIILFWCIIQVLHVLYAVPVQEYLHNGFVSNPQTMFAPDVSFCIVDLKYNKGTLKICELGQGAVSGFIGHQRLYGRNKIWVALWDFLTSFNCPIFYLGGAQSGGKQKALTKLQQHGGIFVPSIENFDNIMQNIHHSPTDNVCRTIPTSSGILVMKNPHALVKNRDFFNKKYPDLILLDQATRPFVLNKLLTHLLFMNDTDLACYRPQCMILPTHHSPDLARRILSTIPSNKYVIKPINGFKGKGICFVTKKSLNPTLKEILQTKSSTKAPYAFWKKYKNPYFLVESLESSQHISIGNKTYDPTMRVAFGIAYNAGQITIKFFGAYWKLPEKPISSNYSLEDRYKSHIIPNRRSSAKVDPKTYQEVTNLLSKFLPKVYLKMLAAYHTPGLLPELKAEINGNGLQPSSDNMKH